MTTIALRTDAPRARRKGRKLTMTRAQVGNLGRAITVGLGVGIPLLSLSLSHLGGHLLATGSPWLGCLALLLCVSVLGVSLGHLAAAIADITRSGRYASWSLAITVDLSILLCELVGVFGDGGVEHLRTGLMVAVSASSAVLNVWAFLRIDGK